MRKGNKAITLLATLGLFSGGLADEPIQSVTQTVNQIRFLVADKSQANALFDKVADLTVSVSNLYEIVSEHKEQITLDGFYLLDMTNSLLNMSFELVKHNFTEEELFTTYYKPMRAFSDAISRLEIVTTTIKDRLGLIKRVQIKGLELSRAEIEKLANDIDIRREWGNATI